MRRGVLASCRNCEDYDPVYGCTNHSCEIYLDGLEAEWENREEDRKIEEEVWGEH